MQHRHAPRPLPLFLQLVAMLSEDDPEFAAQALEGLGRYERSPRPDPPPLRPAIARCGTATLRDCGGTGPAVVLVPSLINPPRVLDLDDGASLAQGLAAGGRRALLVDWGKAADRQELDLGGHVAELLVPLLEQVDEPPALVGYCLGGTLAMAAAQLLPLERVATLAAPWHFSAYPQSSRQSLGRLWEAAKPTARQLGVLPMEVLQSAFWSLDPKRTVSKFARFAQLGDDSRSAARFVALEDWANEGEPLPFPAARELIEDFFGDDLPGKGKWKVGGIAATDALACPALHITARDDRIAPFQSAPGGQTLQIGAGHVGMVVGSARSELHAAINDFLAAEPARR